LTGGFPGANSFAKKPGRAGFCGLAGLGTGAAAGFGGGGVCLAGTTGLIVFFGAGFQAALSFVKNPGLPEDG
jgi:hypothetical protein